MPLKQCPSPPPPGQHYNPDKIVVCNTCKKPLKYYCEFQDCGYSLGPTHCTNQNPPHPSPTSPTPHVDDHCHCPYCGIDIQDKRYTCYNCAGNFQYYCPICGVQLPKSTDTTHAGHTFYTVCPSIPRPRIPRSQGGKY